MAYNAPDPYREAIRGPVAWWATADATIGDSLIVEGLRPTGGSTTDTSRPGVRRALSLNLAPEPGLFEALTPAGTRLAVTTHVKLIDRTIIDIPMGVFVVSRERITEGAGALSITAPDKWSLIQAARFIGPAASTPGLLVTQQIVALIQGALGVTETVVVTATSEALVGALTWEKDRDKAILDLAKGIGAWVYFDRLGVATVADLPTVAAADPDWVLDSGDTGVLTSLDRERSRDTSYNVVVISSSAADGETFKTQWVWDQVHNSPTYAGPDPVQHPEKAGPFGVATYYFDTPLPLTDAEANTAAQTMLARVTGLASQVSLGGLPNPAIDALDSIAVTPPAQPRSSEPAQTERHLADNITHPLVPGATAQSIEGRSTQVDYVEGLS